MIIRENTNFLMTPRRFFAIYLLFAEFSTFKASLAVKRDMWSK